MKLTIERKEKAPERKEFIKGEGYLSKHEGLVICTEPGDNTCFSGMKLESGHFSTLWRKEFFIHFPCEVIIKEI